MDFFPLSLSAAAEYTQLFYSVLILFFLLLANSFSISELPAGHFRIGEKNKKCKYIVYKGNEQCLFWFWSHMHTFCLILQASYFCYLMCIRCKTHEHVFSKAVTFYSPIYGTRVKHIKHPFSA